MRAVKADLDQARQEIEVPAAAPEGTEGQPMEEEAVEGITDAILERLSANATVSDNYFYFFHLIKPLFLEIDRAEKTKRPKTTTRVNFDIRNFKVRSKIKFPSITFGIGTWYNMSRHSSKCFGDRRQR